MSDKPGRAFFWLKVVLRVALLVAIGAAAVVYVRATAKVEVVVSGDAIDARPGSVTVKEEEAVHVILVGAGEVRYIGVQYDSLPGERGGELAPDGGSAHTHE